MDDLLRMMMPEDGAAIEDQRRAQELAHRRRVCRHTETNYAAQDCSCAYCGDCEQRIFACSKHLKPAEGDARDIERPGI